MTLNAKSVLIAAAFLATCLGASSASASTTVGQFDSGNCYPFACNDSRSSTGLAIDYQQIYAASAFSGPITFDAITFFAWAGAPAPQLLSGNYDITFSTTTSPLNSKFPITLSNTQTFYSGSSPFAANTYTIAGSTFTYDPSLGDLVMEIKVTDQAKIPNGPGVGYFEADYTGLETLRAYHVKHRGYHEGVGALVTEFDSAAVPEPATWALMLVGFGGLGAALRRRRVAVGASA